MQQVQVDRLYPEPLELDLAALDNVIRRQIRISAGVGIEVAEDLRTDDQLVARHILEGLTQDGLGQSVPVRISGVEEVYSVFKRYLNYLYSYFDVNQLMEDLAQLDPKARFVQIIGHNPSIPEIGADLTGSFPDSNYSG